MRLTQHLRTVSYDEFKAMRRFPAFDGLRAIAAALVVVFHFGGPGWAWTAGWIGVHIFFVLSGFLITTLLLREEERNGRISLRGFYVRRFFRIMPVYLVVLGITWALAHLNGEGDQVRKSLWHYLFLMNEFAPTPIYLHTWTIGIEQKFYLFWPLSAFVLVAGFRKKITARLAVTTAAIIVLLSLVKIPSAMVWPFWPTHYVVILVGCGLAIVMHHPRGYALVRPLTHPVTATLVALAFIGVHLRVQYWAWPTVGFPKKELLAYAVAVAALIPALLSNALPAKLLSLKPMVFIGERSYSLYLIQVLVRQWIWMIVIPWKGQLNTYMVIAGLIVGLVVADVLYRWVELPMINVGRRLATPRKRRDRDSRTDDRTGETPATAAQPDAVSPPAGTAAPL